MGNREVLVVEDDESVARAMRRDLDGMGVASRHAVDLKTLRDTLDKELFAAVVLDLHLPDGDTLELVSWLAARCPVMVVTGESRSEIAADCIEAGATFFVKKPIQGPEFRARVGRMLPWLRTKVVLGGCEVNLTTRMVVREGVRKKLRPIEASLLRYFAAHPNTDITRDELLREVLGRTVYEDARLVDAHIAALRQRIEATPSRPEFLVTVRGVGYRLRMP